MDLRLVSWADSLKSDENGEWAPLPPSFFECWRIAMHQRPIKELKDTLAQIKVLRKDDSLPEKRRSTLLSLQADLVFRIGMREKSRQQADRDLAKAQRFLSQNLEREITVVRRREWGMLHPVYETVVWFKNIPQCTKVILVLYLLITSSLLGRLLVKE